MKKRLEKIIGKFPRLKVVVFGDIISDEYVFGATSRVSREAPVLVLKYQSRRLLLGGAANTAHNIRSLGGKALLVGVIGDDRSGEELLGVMRASGLTTRGIIRVKGRQTTVKTRILAGGLHTSRQQVIRIDRETASPIGEHADSHQLAQAERAVKSSHSLLVSDYGLGTVTDEGVRWVNGVAAGGKRIVTVDSRFRIRHFKCVTGAKQNEPEVEEALHLDLTDDRKVLEAGSLLLKAMESGSLIITRGKKGMAIFARDESPRLIPVYGSDEVADVTGAGDTVIGAYTLALTAGATNSEAALVATYAAGIVVMKQGTATVTRRELLQAVRSGAVSA